MKVILFYFIAPLFENNSIVNFVMLYILRYIKIKNILYFF